MKKNIHPNYRNVIFHDTTANKFFKIKSTINTNLTIKYKKKNYPYVKCEISSKSHPFYTQKQRIIIKDGSTSRFNKKFNKFFKN